MPSDSEEIATLKLEVARQAKIIDALAKHLGVSQNDLLAMQTGGGPADVIEALRAGNLIEAIKRYRAHTGVGLAEAKAAVDDLHRGLR
jgi:large subunit ribosomal protein L7/L12